MANELLKQKQFRIVYPKNLEMFWVLFGKVEAKKKVYLVPWQTSAREHFA